MIRGLQLLTGNEPPERIALRLLFWVKRNRMQKKRAHRMVSANIRKIVGIKI